MRKHFAKPRYRINHSRAPRTSVHHQKTQDRGRKKKKKKEIRESRGKIDARRAGCDHAHTHVHLQDPVVVRRLAAFALAECTRPEPLLQRLLGHDNRRHVCHGVTAVFALSDVRFQHWTRHGDTVHVPDGGVRVREGDELPGEAR